MGRSADDRSTDLLPDMGPQEYWEPEKWGPRHSLVARLSGAGIRNKEIAEITGFGEARVSQILCDARAKEVIRAVDAKIADNIADLSLRLKAHAAEALGEIVDQMRNPVLKAETRQRAALAILDRAGYTPVQRHALVAPPTLPDGLASLVAETHEEMRVIRRTTQYGLPPGQDVTPLASSDVPEEAA